MLPVCMLRRFPPVTMQPGLESIAEACTPCSGSSAAPSRSSSCQEMHPIAEADAPSPCRTAAAAADAGSSSERQQLLVGGGAAQSSSQRPLVCPDAAATDSSQAWSISQQLQQAFVPTWLTQLQKQQQEAGEFCDGAC
jgi:hypothetical protein